MIESRFSYRDSRLSSTGSSRVPAAGNVGAAHSKRCRKRSWLQTAERNTMQTFETVSRRGVLKTILSSASFAAVSRVAYCSAPATHGAFVETQSTGAEIWQVTTKAKNPSNIYCEVPYCSRDSRYFVYATTNHKLKMNPTEFRVVEVGTWKQERLDSAQSLNGCAVSPLSLIHI